MIRQKIQLAFQQFQSNHGIVFPVHRKYVLLFVFHVIAGHIRIILFVFFHVDLVVLDVFRTHIYLLNNNVLPSGTVLYLHVYIVGMMLLYFLT